MCALNVNHPQRKTLRARGRLALEAPRHGGGLDLKRNLSLSLLRVSVPPW
jgi:hypothetical protein